MNTEVIHSQKLIDTYLSLTKMKKFLKIFLISFASLIGILIVTISILLWVVFTPKKLTPIVQKQVSQYVTCESKIGEVELTFFSTFPKFGIKINQTTLINPVVGATNDTLLNLKNVIGIVNISSLVKEKELIINDFRLNSGQISIFTDSVGKNNYDVFTFETDSAKDDTTEIPFKIIDIQNVELNNVDIKYVDDQLNLNADFHNFTAKINGKMRDDIIKGIVDIKPFDLLLDYKLDETSRVTADINKLSLNLKGEIENETIAGDLIINQTDINFHYKSDSLDLVSDIKDFAGSFDVCNYFDGVPDAISAKIVSKPFLLSLNFNGDNYLKNTQFQLNTNSIINLSRQLVVFKETKLSVNDLSLSLSGSVENDTINSTLITDIEYNFENWNIKKIIALIPEMFSSYLEGIDVTGIISSKGTISGNYNDKNIPAVDILFDLKNGTLIYDSLPLPLSQINGNIRFVTDFKSPTSYVRVNNFSANTPQSSINTKGTITNLFGDIRADLNTVAFLNLTEFQPMMPDSLNLNMKGSVFGNINSLFLMSQIEKMEFEKMKISGALTFSDFAFNYDSISVGGDKTKLEFTMPNDKAIDNETGFLWASLSSGVIAANKLETFNTSLKNVEFKVETSDIRDSTRIPNVLCSFEIGLLTANMDSIGVSIIKPKGKITISPRKRNPKHPEINLVYNSEKIDGDFEGQSLIIEKINLEFDVENNPNRKQFLAQWRPHGAVNMENARFISPTFAYPVDIPSVKMHFDPETFTVENAKFIIDKSDFELNGQIINISSYFRKDSILRGNLHLMSDMTDIIQLMALTSGIGQEDNLTDEYDNQEVVVTKLADAIVDQESYQGPYMVPRGIDFLLQTNINKATYGSTVASNIKGNVQIFDGLLVLDELSFSTPAADMLVTAIYRTARKNHLFTRMSLHMLDIEIAELLNLAPDLDTIMPMLRSFAGNAEFHFAFETNMDSLYNMKKSTIRGASSIRGINLVLMDSETYGSIAKTLRFSRKTENKVDSLSAEFTVFRNEIDVYPFLIVMDKYKGVVGGRHNLDMSFDYNISLVDSPLPIRLHVDVKGTPEKMKYGLRLRSRYPKFYRPHSPKLVENEQRNLRNIIRESLLKSIAPKTIEEENEVSG